MHQATGFDLLVPMVIRPAFRRQLQALPEERFTRPWAGYATARLTYRLTDSTAGPFPLFVQRFGEQPRDLAVGTPSSAPHSATRWRR